VMAAPIPNIMDVSLWNIAMNSRRQSSPTISWKRHQIIHCKDRNRTKN
jgi:hypothetical protein